jgi:hypothetical protein
MMNEKKLLKEIHNDCMNVVGNLFHFRNELEGKNLESFSYAEHILDIFKKHNYKPREKK